MGGGKGDTGTQKTVAEPWKAAQPLLKNLIGDVGSMYGSGGMTWSPWQGPRVAPQSNITQTGLQNFYDTGVAGNPFMQQAAQNYGDLASGSGHNPAMGQLSQNILADVIPAVSSRFTNSGVGDSSMAMDTIARSASEALAPAQFGAYENMQNRRMGALGMAPQLGEGSYIDVSRMLGAGNMLDQYNQSVLGSAMDQYSQMQQYPYEGLQRAVNMGGYMGGMGGSSKGETGEDKGIMSTVGSIAQIAGPLLGMFMSDRRLKVDIALIGKTVEGYNKYRYRYAWDGPEIERIGVMADEVPEELTATIPGTDLKMVDYSRINMGGVI